jgi:hypothetical protein
MDDCKARKEVYIVNIWFFILMRIQRLPRNSYFLG